MNERIKRLEHLLNNNPGAVDAIIRVSQDNSTLVMSQPILGDAVRVFVNVNGNWVYKYKLSVPGLKPSDMFGEALSVSSTGERIAIGAPGTSVGYTTAGWVNGVVYVFDKIPVGDKWKHTAVVTTDEPQPRSSFGFNVVMTGDGSTMVVGCSNATVNGIPRAGCVYVLTCTDTRTGWQEEAILTSSHPKEDGLFGYDSTITPDGKYIIAVSPRENVHLERPEEAYVFTKIKTEWTHVKKLRPLRVCDLTCRFNSGTASEDGRVELNLFGLVYEFNVNELTTDQS